MTAEEIIERLDYKEVELMLNFCCDSGGYADGDRYAIDTEGYTTSYSPAFNQIGIKKQLVAKGQVEVNWPQYKHSTGKRDGYSFNPAYIGEIETIYQSGYFYGISGSGVKWKKLKEIEINQYYKIPELIDWFE